MAGGIDGGDGQSTEYDAQSADANGTVEVIVYVDDAEVPLLSADRDVGSIQAAAAESQAPVLEYVEETEGLEATNQFWLVNAVLVEVDTNEVDVDRLVAQESVRSVHANYEYETPETTATADDVTGAGATTYGLEQINAPDVWAEHGTKGSDVKVAVLDTGVDASHPDLELTSDDPTDPTHPGGWAEFDGDGNRIEDSTPYDSSDHGTHVSGTVAGGDASGTAIGVAPEADLMHGLVLDGGRGTFAQIVGGMEWAVQEDADIVSMSLGGDGFHGELIEPIQAAEDQGTLVVAAAGNAGPETSGSPGNIYDSFAIGASDENREIGYFSSGDTVVTDRDWGDQQLDHWPEQYIVPDVAAPGVDVVSTMPGGEYAANTGTSMATPHVSGAAALMISAAGGDLSPAETRAALIDRATKPDGEDPEQDTRYGHGIIDVMSATTEVAAPQGVEGTVTDADGNPLSDVRVETDTGSSTSTDASGAYLIRTLPGEYEVTASAFGYESATETVTVDEEAMTPLEFALEPTLDVAVDDPQDRQVEAGDASSVTYDVAHADELTVQSSGDYAGELTLFVDGEERAFGETIDLGSDGSYSGSVSVTVETEAGTDGTFSLEHALEGQNETETIETGPIAVVADPIYVGVVDSDESEHAAATMDAMDAALGDEYFLSVLSPEDAIADVDAYDVLVVHHVEDDDEMETLVDATSDPGTGVVYLDQRGDTSNGVSKLSAVTRNPVLTAQTQESPPPEYEIVADHPIVDGVATVDESITIHGHPRGDLAWFDGFRGTTLATAADGDGTVGTGIAIDESSQTVLVSSLGRSATVRNTHVTGESDALLANAIEHANTLPPAWYGTEQPAHVEPGEAFEMELEAHELDGFSVSLDEGSTANESNLSLSVDGNASAFGEWHGVDAGQETVTVEIDTSAETVGSVDLVTDVEGGDQEAELLSGPTAVYEAPLVVPDDVETIQEAVDLAPAGATVEVAGGEYEERVEITTPDLTLTAHDDGDTPVVENVIEGFDDMFEPGIFVDAPNVTVEHVEVDVQTESIAQGFGIEVDRRNATVRDVSVQGAQEGILIGGADSDASGTVVTDVEVSDGAATFSRGVIVGEADDVHVSNATVTGQTRGIDVYISVGTVVEDNTVSESDRGIASANTDDVQIVGNEIDDVDVGIQLEKFVLPETVAHNEISNAETGILVEGTATGGPIVHNEIDAEYGIALERGDSPALEIEYNDLSATDVAIVNGFDETIRAPLNYFGERTGNETFVGDDVVYEPFLTAHPDEVDADEPRRIGVDLTFEAGDTYGVSIPGSTEQTVSDLFDDEFEGVVYGFDATTQEWEQRLGDDRVGALDALVVVAANDGRMTISHHDSSDTPASPGQVTVTEGWNFVGVPQYGALETAYEYGTMSPTLAMDPFEAPAAQLGERGGFDGTYYFGEGRDVHVSPYEGYFVFVEEEGTVPAEMPPNPTAGELLDGVGLGTGALADGPATDENESASLEGEPADPSGAIGPARAPAVAASG